MQILERSLTLVGPGRAGMAFARSWIGAGGRVGGVLVRETGPQAREFAGATFSLLDRDPLAPADLLILSVPDDAIAPLAQTLAGRIRCTFAGHFSGALSSQALTPFSDAGASVASLHPLRPFTGAGAENWNGAFVAVEGDPRGAATADEIARALGASPHRIGASEKPLYHAAASLAAGGTAALIAVAARLWAAAGIPEDVAREALAGLAARAAAALESRPFADALTGAAARRDVGTLRAHAESLAPHPEALRLYAALAEEMLRRTPGRGKEAEIRSILVPGRKER